MAVRSFDGTDDFLTLSQGNVDLTGAFTIGFIVNLDDTTDGAPFFLGTVGTTSYRTAVEVFSGDWVVFGGDGASVSFSTNAVTGGWELVLVTKASGSVTPRIHRYNFTGASWSHENASGALADAVGSANGIQIGRWGSSECLAGDLAVVGVWESVIGDDTAIENAGLEDAFTNWRDLDPSGLWLLNQPSVTELCIDYTTGLADQTARTGTSVTTGADPAGLNFTVAELVEFTDSANLPGGWRSVTPSGSSVNLGPDYAEIEIDPNQDFDSLSTGLDHPEGPLIYRQISGAFDFAVGLAEELSNLPTQGLDMLALDSTHVDGVRAAGYTGTQAGDFRNDIGWFIFATDVGTVLNTTGDTIMSGLYGGPGWLRLEWDGSSSWTMYASHTGVSGSWVTIDTWTSSFSPTRFALHAVAFPSGSDGRVQRVQRVVDLLARGSDEATTPRGSSQGEVLYSEDFSGGTLPAWLTAQTANGGAVSTTVSGAELSIDESQTNSQAWLVGPDDLPPNHGILVQYQLTANGYLNAFWIPTIAMSTTTDITGAATPDDNYGDGVNILMEMPARDHVSDGQLVRLVRKSPIRSGATLTGNREFDGYTLIVEDSAAPVTAEGKPLSWIRMERVHNRIRVRLWLDAVSEPSTWHYEIEDHMRFGSQVAFTLSQNDSVSGAGTAAVRLSYVEIYASTVTAAADLGGLTATAAGVAFVGGDALADLGGLAATATGLRQVSGTGTGSYGLAAAATGLRTVHGVAAGSYGFSAAAEGFIPVIGDALADLGGLTAVAVGTRVATGVALADLGGLLAHAEAPIAVTGVALADLGGLAAAALGVPSHLPRWMLRNPTYEENLSSNDRLFIRYRLPRGVTLAITGTTVVELIYPFQEDLEQYDLVFLGGFDHPVTSQVADILTAAGYGGFLTPIKS